MGNNFSHGMRKISLRSKTSKSEESTSKRKLSGATLVGNEDASKAKLVGNDKPSEEEKTELYNSFINKIKSYFNVYFDEIVHFATIGELCTDSFLPKLPQQWKSCGVVIAGDSLYIFKNSSDNRWSLFKSYEITKNSLAYFKENLIRIEVGKNIGFYLQNLQFNRDEFDYSGAFIINCIKKVISIRNHTEFVILTRKVLRASEILEAYDVEKEEIPLRTLTNENYLALTEPLRIRIEERLKNQA